MGFESMPMNTENTEGEKSKEAEEFEKLKAESLSILGGEVKPLIEKWVELEYSTRGDRNKRGDEWFDVMRSVTALENKTRDELLEPGRKAGVEAHNFETGELITKILNEVGEQKLTPREREEMGDIRAGAH